MDKTQEPSHTKHPKQDSSSSDTSVAKLGRWQFSLKRLFVLLGIAAVVCSILTTLLLPYERSLHARRVWEGLGAKVRCESGSAIWDFGENVTEVSASCSKVTDSEMAYLARLPRVRYLDLSECAVGNDGLRHVSQLGEIECLSLCLHFLKRPPILLLHINGSSVIRCFPQDTRRESQGWRIRNVAGSVQRIGPSGASGWRPG